jgi:hypothetical protein
MVEKGERIIKSLADFAPDVSLLIQADLMSAVHVGLYIGLNYPEYTKNVLDHLGEKIACAGQELAEELIKEYPFE